jgi:hypothetical protein
MPPPGPQTEVITMVALAASLSGKFYHQMGVRQKVRY